MIFNGSIKVGESDKKRCRCMLPPKSLGGVGGGGVRYSKAWSSDYPRHLTPLYTAHIIVNLLLVLTLFLHPAEQKIFFAFHIARRKRACMHDVLRQNIRTFLYPLGTTWMTRGRHVNIMWISLIWSTWTHGHGHGLIFSSLDPYMQLING